MVALYFVFFFIGILIFLWMTEFSMFMRLVVAFSVFLVPSISITVWLAKIGDKPPPNSVIIVPKHSNASESHNVEAENLIK